MKTSNKLLTGLFIFLAIAIFSIVLIGRMSMETYDMHDIKGSGNLSEEYRQTDPFTGLTVGSGIQVELSKGDNAVTLKVEDNVLEFIETTVKDGVLKVRWKNGTSVNLSYPVTAKVAMPSLEYLNISSSASVKTTDNFAGENVHVYASSGANMTLQGLTAESLEVEANSNSVIQFEQGISTETKADLTLNSGSEVYFKSLTTQRMVAKMSSNSSMKLSGTANTLRVSGSSGAEFKGAGFSVVDADLDGSSNSIFEVEVSNNLNANLNSGSEVRYRGEAKVIEHTNSGSSVRKVD